MKLNIKILSSLVVPLGRHPLYVLTITQQLHHLMTLVSAGKITNKDKG